GGLARALDSEGQVVGVVGEAGVGKSRVCLEFVNRCRGRGIAVHEAHCPAHGATVPLLPIRELVRSYLGLGDGDPAEAVRQRVADRLRDLGPEAADAPRVVLDLLGAPETHAPTSAASRSRTPPMPRRDATSGSRPPSARSFASGARASRSCCCSTTSTGSTRRAMPWWES